MNIAFQNFLETTTSQLHKGIVLLLPFLFLGGYPSFGQHALPADSLSSSDAVIGYVNAQMDSVNQGLLTTIAVRQTIDRVLYHGDTSLFLDAGLNYIYLLDLQSEYKEAVIFGQYSTGIAEAIQYQHLGDYLNWMGNSYYGIGDHVQSIRYYYQAADWFKRNDELNAVLPLGNIASTYYDIKDYKKCIQYTKEAMAYSNKLEDDDYRHYNLTFDHISLGDANMKLGNVELAESHYEKALEVVQYQGDQDLVVNTLSRAIDFYVSQQQSIKVVTLIKQGKKVMSQNFINAETRTEFFLEASKYYLDAGQVNLAIPPDSIKRSTNTEGDLYKYAFKYYTAIGNPTKATQFVDSISNVLEREKNLHSAHLYTNLEAEYIAQQLESRNEALMAEAAHKRKNLLVALFVVILLVSWLLILIYFNQKTRRLNRSLSDATVQLQATNERLLQSNEELERFAHIASHDLKTPVRNINSFTSLIAREIKQYDNPKLLSYLDFVRTSGRQMIELIEGVLEHSKLNSNTEIEQINLNVLLKDVLFSISGFLEEKNAEVILFNALPMMNAHRHSLFLLFKNLIENGIKYNESNQPVILISSRSDEAHLTITFEDNGIGVSEEFHEEVFKMFKRLHTNTEYEGTGLGLSLCKKIVDQFEGTIALDSNPGSGSVFTVSIPQEHIASHEPSTVLA